MIRRYTWRLLIFAAIIIYALWRNYRVSHDIRFTIATTMGKVFTARNNFQMEYQFTVNEKQYTGYSADIRHPEGRYYVKFPYKSPGAGEIQWDQPVPDSIIIIPSEGWKELP